MLSSDILASSRFECTKTVDTELLCKPAGASSTRRTWRMSPLTFVQSLIPQELSLKQQKQRHNKLSSAVQQQKRSWLQQGLVACPRWDQLQNSSSSTAHSASSKPKSHVLPCILFQHCAKVHQLLMYTRTTAARFTLVCQSCSSAGHNQQLQGCIHSMLAPSGRYM